MNGYRKQLLSLFLMVLVALVSCRPVTPAGSPEAGTAEGDAGMANPAAVYCEGLGYRLEPRETAAGATAVCIFPEGSECDEWDFLAGRCGTAYSYCASQGGTLVPEEDSNIGTCILADGTRREEYAFFQGE